MAKQSKADRMAQKRAMAAERLNISERVTAVHEAGHAVVASATGLTVDGIAINGANGITYAATSALVYLSGIVAVDVLLNGNSNSGLGVLTISGGADDVSHINHLSNGAKTDLIAESNRLVKENSGAIMAVADSLMARKTLTGDEFRAILNAL